MIREKIIASFSEILTLDNKQGKSEFQDDTILLESGLNSLGFATLVAHLEEKLGYDPFTLMSEPVYPVTFGEFVHIYEKFKEHALL